MVVLPQFTVSANETITADARTAASKVHISTPLPAVQQSEQVNVERIAQDRQKFTVSVDNDGSQSTGFYVTGVDLQRNGNARLAGRGQVKKDAQDGVRGSLACVLVRMQPGCDLGGGPGCAGQGGVG
jgi:carbon monoxide dehydrogenase subunit G